MIRKVKIKKGLFRKDQIFAVLFDWDGCLVDNYNATYRTYREVLKEFNTKLERKTFGMLYSPDQSLFYKRLNLPKKLWKKIDEKWE